MESNFPFHFFLTTLSSCSHNIFWHPLGGLDPQVGNNNVYRLTKQDHKKTFLYLTSTVYD